MQPKLKETENPYGILSEYGHFIGGEWVSASGGETIDLMNPATGEVLSRIQAGTPDDINRAVAAAKAAFPSWSQSSASQRQEILFEMARRLKARMQDYAVFETLNNGKPIREGMFFDLPTAITQFEVFAGAAYGIHGETHNYADAIGIVHREPLGVCAQIIPWNVPMIMMASKIAPALAAGNTIVLKPAETVCLSVMEFFREMADLIPAGVVNVVTGYGAAVGEALVTHPDVRKVAFTGSVATARRIIQYASENVIPQTLELGGKSAHIVCADADIDAAVEAATMSTVLNKGEVCLAGSRMFLHESIEEEFLEKFKNSLANIRQGDPMDPATQLGAQASQMQMDKVQSYLKLAIEEGATAHIGGARNPDAALAKGHFIQPTIFTNVANDMRIAQEEIFGPVTTTMTWKDEDEMIKRANHTTYGLAGGVWTRDIYRAHRIARQLETGTVWINRYYNLKPNMPVGGYKQSGYGREFSHEVLNHYTQTKSVVVNLHDSKIGMFDQ
jgi:acyl-CoA reductase-like NAD-dependent aldehyde dehydrogenase